MNAKNESGLMEHASKELEFFREQVIVVWNQQ